MNLARSPYIVEIDLTGVSNVTGSKLELYLGTNIGTANPSYTFEKLIPASNNLKMYYNISPYIREYFDFTVWQNATGLAYNIATSTNFVVPYEVKRYKDESGTFTLLGTDTGNFMDGYNYYMDGYNATAVRVFLDEGEYFYNYDATIPTSQGNGIWGSFDVDMSTGDTIKYTNLRTGATHTETASGDGVKSFARVYLSYAADGNKVEMFAGGSSLKWTGTFKPQCEPKYKPVVIDFVNRYGSWSRIFFQKANKRSVAVKTNEYKFNPKELPYTSANNGQAKELNTNGIETITLNTGWVNDNYADYLEQLLLSERVTLLDYDVNPNYTPVKVKSKTLKKQTGLNDGMINYTLEFEFAFDILNNVI